MNLTTVIRRPLAAMAAIALTFSTDAAGEPAAREYHVSMQGNDANEGSAAKTLRTISAAAAQAQPGDLITVHQGTYRERIRPPRGGESDTRRIVYQAAAGEKVLIKGSELTSGWKKGPGDTWKLSVPNSIFGDFNPYADLIHGDWFTSKGRQHHTGAVYLDGHWLTEAAKLDDLRKPIGKNPLWFAEVGDRQTLIHAQFKDDPNRHQVEINVRQAVFYPEKPGINYLTVRGFTMEHAATPWSPPTAEQIGLIGTHWSKGWIIEDNTIRYSTCVGITLGKHGDRWDNTSQNAAVGYVKTIERGLENGWSKENIGHHLVLNNRIAHCEQAGIVGSLGAVFSTIRGNLIHDIHVRRLFTGAEQAGIKIHAAIDSEISGNHIHRSGRGIWLDWMAQGTRVFRNLLHDNNLQDLFVEVNHGPFMVDHNLFLSAHSLLDVSQGGAYAHNLFAGKLTLRPELKRSTPFHKPHSTELAGSRNIAGGDDRFFNNLFLKRSGLGAYNKAALPVRMKGNVFIQGAQASKHEQQALRQPDFDPGLRLRTTPEESTLEITLERSWLEATPRDLISSELLGMAAVTGLPYLQPDGKPYLLDRDFMGEKRDPAHPFPGPFERPAGGRQTLKVWPVKK